MLHESLVRGVQDSSVCLVASLVELLDEFAIHEHEKIAEALDALRDRLGRDNLSMNEWNALVSAASDERLAAWRRRERARIAQ